MPQRNIVFVSPWQMKIQPVVLETGCIVHSGKATDLTILAQDLRRLGPDEIEHADVVATVVDGRDVHRTKA